MLCNTNLAGGQAESYDRVCLFSHTKTSASINKVAVLIHPKPEVLPGSAGSMNRDL